MASRSDESTTGTTDLVPIDIRRAESWWARFRAVLKEDRTGRWSMWLLIVFVLALLISPYFIHNWETQTNFNIRTVAPFSLHHGWRYVLGSDELGRSFLARLVYGGRTAVIIATLAVIVAAVVGSGMGMIAGYFGGIYDAVFMRFTDIMLAFPSMLLALVVLYSFPSGIVTLVVVLAIGRIPVYIRMARAETLEQRDKVYVVAARALGASSPRILCTEIAPAIASSVVTLSTLQFATVMLAESGLDFLGVGLQSPNVSWGLLVAEGRNQLRAAWWLTALPGLAIVVITVLINLFSNVISAAKDPV